MDASGSPGAKCRGRRRAWGLRRALSVAALLGTAPLLGGCQFALMDPRGPIGADEKSIIILSTVLMLIVVVPVIVMTLAFAWRYRASNSAATYAPEWEHSRGIETVVWLVPCLIIAALGTVTWISSHRLDPYRPIKAAAKPLTVQVVSLDWKWLFIYPEQHIASVNQLALPVGVPVKFLLTSSSVMNAFFIPRLGTQIYTMAGMQTQLSLLASKAGDYRGISANYSGDGFSDMHFTAEAMSGKDFAAWVAKARASSQALTLASYRALAQPSERVPVRYYSSVTPALFHDILNQCTNGAPCRDAAMAMAMAKEALGSSFRLCTTINPAGNPAGADPKGMQ
jgi:cytochrome o ubiquinol oxidase subunit 2